jgi:hypothetical protein
VEQRRDNLAGRVLGLLAQTADARGTVKDVHDPPLLSGWWEVDLDLTQLSSKFDQLIWFETGGGADVAR